MGWPGTTERWVPLQVPSPVAMAAPLNPAALDVAALGPEAAGVAAALEAAARDLAFSWHPALRDLFAEADPDPWERVCHNPVALVRQLAPAALERLAADPSYGSRLAAARAAVQAEETGPTWWRAEHHAEGACCIAYFSCEFAVDESLPIYSGGLGVLAGDHLKACSELGIPLVGVGLLYKQGYFRQTLDSAGWQVERYPVNDPERLPLVLERREDGSPLRVHLDLAGEPVTAQIWRADVGRVRLYLLDTDLGGNSRAARAITDTLYGGDREHRIRQEVLLGRGGVRALCALDGYGEAERPPDAWWFRPDGLAMSVEDWHEPRPHAIGLFLHGELTQVVDEHGRPQLDDSFLLLVNASPGDVEFALPHEHLGRAWALELSTADLAVGAGGPDAPRGHLPPAGRLRVEQRSLAVLRQVR